MENHTVKQSNVALKSSKECGNIQVKLIIERDRDSLSTPLRPNIFFLYMPSQTDKMNVSGEDVAAKLDRLVFGGFSKKPGSESASQTSCLRKELEVTDEETRQRREARMKRLLEKKERKREKLRDEMTQENETKLKEQQPSERNHSHVEVSKTASHLGSEKSLKLKIKVKKKPEQTVSLKTTTSQDSNSDGIREKSKKSKPPKISFPINEECTSIKLAPSGRHIIAGFTDGTLRLFDTTGRLWKPRSSSTGSNNSVDDTVKSEISCLFDSDSDEENDSNHSKRSSKQRMVASKSFQNFGAVACQIHAKGVITSLLMDVDCCEDGKFAFGGVLRGSTELVAVDLSEIEKFHNQFFEKGEHEHNKKRLDILDLIKVYRFSDAKLKGFGACIKLQNTDKLEYRLFTGKGIKNMHIWSFVPPSGDVKEPTWQCLYDTPTNGNTISYLKFRRDAYGLLQGISKSDDQKLRIWDLSYEEHGPQRSRPQLRTIIKQLGQKSEKETCDGRPKRPPYVDVLSTENALGVCGAYVFSGGDSMYNKMGVMYLDVEDIQSQFNHTELALPNVSESVDSLSFLDSGRRSARTGRQQRGDLKSVVKVAGLGNDAHHVLLELSDQTLVHYCQKGNQSSLTPLRLHNSSQAGRKIGVSYVHLKDSYILTISSYEAAKSRGSITLRYLSDNLENGSVGHSVRMAFTEGRVRPKKNFEIDNIATNKNLKHSTKDVVVSSHSKEESLVIDKKSHPTYVSDPKRSRQATTLPEKADHRMETKNQRTNVSNSGRMIDASMSITPNSNKVVETRESNTYLAPSLASDKRSSTKLDEPQLASKSQHLKGTETIPPTSFLPRKKSNDAKNDKPQNCDGSTVRFSTAPEMRVRQTNIAMSEKAGDNNMGTDKSTKKEESVMSNNATLINKYTGVRMRSNSIHSLKVDRQSISDSSAANTSVDGPMPLKKHQKVEKHGMSNVPVQRSMPSDKKIVQAEKHLEVSSSLAQKSFLLTSPIPLKSSHMNNLKLAESDRLSSVSEKGTNEFNLLVTPECKNQEKSLLRLKTPVNSTKQPDSSTIKPMSLHVIDDQKCLNPGNELEAVSRSDMKPNRAAVSPEQSKKDKTNLPENPVIEKSKSISKFFKDASGQKRSKAASNKKDIRKRTETSKEEITEAAKKRRQLYQEIDVASALCELRRIASLANSSGEQPLNTGVESLSPISKSTTEMEDYLAQCHKRKRPKFSRPTNLPSVSVRTEINVPVYKNNGTIFSQDTSLMTEEALDHSHFEARRRLAMHHRASHERLKSAVISSGERMMNLITCNIASSPYNKNQFIDFVTCTLSQELDRHRETLNDMLDRQRLEAASLASTQMLEKGKEAPVLSVSFPFPEVFDQVKQSTIKFLSTV